MVDDDEIDDDGGNGLSHSQIVDSQMETQKDDDMNQTDEGWRDWMMTDEVRWACKDAGPWARASSECSVTVTPMAVTGYFVSVLMV